MSKRMTAGQFKKVITEAGLDFNVYGYEGILNELSLYARSYSAEQKASGFDHYAGYLDNLAQTIYKALDKRGYYDEYEEDE